MSHPVDGNSNQSGADSRADRPDWVTAELLEATLGTWQPFYAEPLTERDALEILVDVGRLIDVLENSNEKTICGPGARFESRARA